MFSGEKKNEGVVLSLIVCLYRSAGGTLDQREAGVWVTVIVRRSRLLRVVLNED